MRRMAEREGPWDLVAASPLARCRAFAEWLAAQAGIEQWTDSRLTEYDFGDWDGVDLDALWARDGTRLAAFLGDPDAMTPPGGETAPAFRARVAAARAELLRRGAGRHVLVVGHGGVLRQFVADALGTRTLHAALEWPHAALSRLHVFDDPPAPPRAVLVFHARVAGDESTRIAYQQVE